MTNPVYIFGMTNPVTFRLSFESSSVKRREEGEGILKYMAKTWVQPHVMSKERKTGGKSIVTEQQQEKQ